MDRRRCPDLAAAGPQLSDGWQYGDDDPVIHRHAVRQDHEGCHGQLRDRRRNGDRTRRLHRRIGTLSFTPGETAKTITVNVVNDTGYEPNETFTLTLTKPVAARPHMISDARRIRTVIGC